MEWPKHTLTSLPSTPTTSSLWSMPPLPAKAAEPSPHSPYRIVSSPQSSCSIPWPDGRCGFQPRHGAAACGAAGMPHLPRNRFQQRGRCFGRGRPPGGTGHRTNRSGHPGSGMNRIECPHPAAVAEGIGSIGVPLPGNGHTFSEPALSPAPFFRAHLRFVQRGAGRNKNSDLSRRDVERQRRRGLGGGIDSQAGARRLGEEQGSTKGQKAHGERG